MDKKSFIAPVESPAGIKDPMLNPPILSPDKTDDILNPGSVPLQAVRLSVCHRLSHASEQVKSCK